MSQDCVTALQPDDRARLSKKTIIVTITTLAEGLPCARHCSTHFTWGDFFFFQTEFHSCCSGWSAMAQSLLTATSASRVQVILLP